MLGRSIVSDRRADREIKVLAELELARRVAQWPDLGRRSSTSGAKLLDSGKLKVTR